jgi:DNA-binding CsgD family transcriptional regulator
VVELLGRAAECAEVTRALAEGGQPLLVMGTAGIGKTAIVHAAIGSRPHRLGRCLPSLSWQPYFPLSDATRVGLAGEPETVAAHVLAALDGAPLVVEDLHWADAHTVAALVLLIQRATVVLTARPGELTATTATTASLAAQCHTLELRPLDEPTSRRLARVLHPTLAEPLRRELVRVAGGNPLLLQHLVSRGRPSRTLRQAMQTRLDDAQPASRELLGRLVLLGRPAREAEIGPGGDDPDIAQFLTVAGGMVDVAHPLLGAVVLAQLDETARRRHHAELGSRLTDHREAAEHLLAGGRASEAAARAEAGLSVESDPAMRARLALVSARAARATGNVDDALWTVAVEALTTAGMWTAALEAAEEAPATDPERHAETLLHAGRAAWYAGDVPGGRATMARASAMAGGKGTALEARIAVEAAYLEVRDQMHGAVAVAERALAVSRRLGAEELRARTILAAALLYEGRPAWDELERVIADATVAREHHLAADAAYHLISALGMFGRLPEAIELGDEWVRRSREHGLASLHLHFLVAHISNSVLAGGHQSWVLEAAPSLVDEYPFFRNRAQIESALVLTLADHGRVAEAVGVADKALGRARNPEELIWAIICRIEMAWLQHDRETATALLHQARSCGGAWFGARVMAEVAAAHLALEADASLDVEQPPFVIPGLWPALHELEAARALSAGDGDAAMEQLVLAADRWAAHGIWRWSARAHFGAAVLGERCRRTDAGSHRREAQGIAERHGLDAHRDRLVARQALPAPLAPRPAITGREAAVLRAVADGLTTVEIASRLGISSTTVETHIRSARAKLGARTRRQAATLFLERAG